MRPVVILVAGDPVPGVRASRGGFAELIRGAAGASFGGPWLDVELRDGSALPEPETLSGAIITGSASSVTDREPWVLRGEAYLRELVRRRVPTFGICFGHQMLGQALGGHVARNPRGREIGTVPFDVVRDDPLFASVHPPCRANTTHVDAVERLPPGATLLATTEREPHAAVRFSETAWGVQFHPEMDGEVVRGYLEARREILVREGFDVDRLIADTDDAPAGRATLARFLEIIVAS